MSEPVYVKIPDRIKEEADLYVKSGYFDNRSELIREALREFLEKLGRNNLEISVGMYLRGEVSLGRAAEIAGVGYEKMKEILAERKIPIRRGPETVGEAEEEYKRFKEIL